MVYHGTIFENNSQESAILGLYLTNILLSVSTVIDLEFFYHQNQRKKIKKTLNSNLLDI